jgi:hypothetical protein
MGEHPDLLILCRFDALNAQNLLYLQAQLIELEEDLRKYARQDAERGASGDNVLELLARD